MENKYLVTLANGVKFSTQDVNLKTTRALLENQKTMAVRLGDKGIQKGLISYIISLEALKTEQPNLILSIAGELFYFEVEDPNAAIETIIRDVNANQWVELDGKIAFNRNTFQYTEVHQEKAQSND